MGFGFLGERGFRVPPADEFLDRRDVDDAVVEVVFDPGHVARQEPAVEMDRVAAERGGAGRAVLAKKGEQLSFGLGERKRGCLHGGGEAGAAVLVGTPFIHGFEDRVGLMDDEVGTFGEFAQVRIGDEYGNFEDVAGIECEAGGLEVYPDERRGWGVIVHNPTIVRFDDMGCRKVLKPTGNFG